MAITTGDLFPDCKQDSPRLAWMKRHNIMLGYNCGADEWCAQVCIAGTWGMAAHHKDRDGALHNLAVKLGIKDWDEEQFARENGK